MSTLYLMVGNIGTGKTTTAKELFKQVPKTFYVSEDDICLLLNMGQYEDRHWDAEHWTMYNKCKCDMLDNALKLGYNIIVDGAHMSKISRAIYIQAAKRNCAEVQAYLHLDPNGLQYRLLDNRSKSEALWTSVYNRYSASYEAPSILEGIHTIHIKNTINS